MKKIFIFAATAALLASCAQDEVLNNYEPTADKAIGFSTFANLITRAENSTATNKSALEYYNKSFYVWGNKNVEEGTELNPSVFFKQKVDFDGTVGASTARWIYTPERYWDKSANFYRFYAVSPAIDGWTTNGSDITTMDGVEDLKFVFTDYVADENITVTSDSAIAAGSTYTQTDDVFTTDKDLMISEDITDWNKVDGTQKVNLDFIHILSRLNIAVKTGLAAVIGSETVTVGTDEYTLYSSNKEGVTDRIGSKDAGTYYKITGDGTEGNAYTLGDQYTPAEGETLTPIYSQEKSHNIVKLTSVEVCNLPNKGTFNEMGYTLGAVNTAAIDADVLKDGTDARWLLASDSKGNVGVAFTNNDNASAFDNVPDPVNTSTYQYVATVTNTADFTNLLDKDNYMFFYQGLVVPQTIKYEKVDIFGNTTYTQPYLKISYTIDGEPFTYYYNLAAAFNYAEYTDANDGKYRKYVDANDDAIKMVYFKDNKYYADDKSTQVYIAYKDGDKYYNVDGDEIYFDGTNYYTNYDEAASPAYTNPLDNQPTIVIKGAQTDDPDYASRIEVASSSLDADACNTTFCEGWQNNLYINIKPATIEFDAEVYKWVTKIDSEDFPIE